MRDPAERSVPSRKGKAWHLEAPIELRRRDPRLGPVIDFVGPYAPTQGGDGFVTLLRAIVSQQVSKYAAEAISGRLHALFPDNMPEPAALLAFRRHKLKGVGLSLKKVEYVRDLARHVHEGRLDFKRLHRMSDEAVIEYLTAVQGIGRWTAEIYLMFHMNRPDVLPLGDAALVNAVREIYELHDEAGAKEFSAVAESWRPYRSVACWYLYRHINMTRAAKAAEKKAAKVKI